jgi:glycosidase
MKAIVQKWQTCMQDNGGWNALFLENHDQSRSVSRFTPHRPETRNAAAKMLATFIGLQSGTLFVYQGQELGMVNLPKDWEIDEYKDFETQNLYRLYVFRLHARFGMVQLTQNQQRSGTAPWRPKSRGAAHGSGEVEGARPLPVADAGKLTPSNPFLNPHAHPFFSSSPVELAETRRFQHRHAMDARQ